MSKQQPQEHSMIERLDLPALACQAAIEVDNLMRGRCATLPACRRMVRVLTQEESLGAARDPVMLAMVQGACAKEHGNGLHRARANLEELINTAAKKIQMEGENGSLESMTALRDFLLAFSREASKRMHPPEAVEAWYRSQGLALVY